MANWLNVYQKEIEPSADAIENAENRKNFLLHLKYYLLNTFVKNNKSELKIWLLQALGNLQIDNRTKSKKIRALFYERENRNYEFERSILKIIVTDKPSAIAKLFRSDHKIFKKYFQSGDTESRIKKWFDWFAYEHVNTKYGAAALQSFAFKNRNDVWDRFLVWSAKRSVTPVIAVVQPWLMMQLDIVATVKNLLDDPREEFWTSSELEESLSNGEFLKVLDSDYFVNELTKILNGERSEELRKELKVIIDSWMDDFSFESVCKNSFHSLNDEQLLQMIKDLISPKNSPKLLQAYLTQLPTLEEILLYNGLTDEYRATFVKNLLAEESQDSRAIIDNLINSILSITNEEQRQMDEISHWALKKRLKNERMQTANKDYLSIIEFECLLLETFLVNYRIASYEPNRVAIEAVMTRAGLHFEAVEEESFKKRKKNKKDKLAGEERKIKEIFIGWHVPAFDETTNHTTESHNNTTPKEESTGIDKEPEKETVNSNNKRKIDAVTPTEPSSSKNTYAMKELPYLLSKLFVRSSLKYAMD